MARRVLHDPGDWLRDQVGNQPLLTRDEEKELVRRASSGDRAAQDELVHRNVGLVMQLATRRSSRKQLCDDAVQGGLIGLMIASRKVSPEYENKFASYATWWIRQVMRRNSAASQGPLRIPAHARLALSQWRMIGPAAEERAGRPLTAREAARLLGVPKHLAEAVLAIDRAELVPILGEDGVVLQLPAPGDAFSAVDDADELAALRQRLAEIMPAADLTPRQAEFFSRVCQAREPQYYAEVAREVGVTRECVRALVATAVTKLQAADGQASCPGMAGEGDLIHRAKLHVRSILADLSPRDAEVLSLIYGLTPAGFITAREAARRTGCSDKTIQNIKRRHLPAGLWRLPRGGFAGKNWAQRASEVECPAP